MADQNESTRQDTLFGVKACALIIALLGLLSAGWVLSSILAYPYNASQTNCFISNGLRLHWWLNFIVSALLTLVSVRSSIALYSGRRWALYTVTFWGLLIASFGGVIIHDSKHPEKQSADEYFVYPLALPLITVGVAMCIYANTSAIRRSLG